jgi:hypothetical protein
MDTIYQLIYVLKAYISSYNFLKIANFGVAATIFINSPYRVVPWWNWLLLTYCTYIGTGGNIERCVTFLIFFKEREPLLLEP